MDLAQKLEFNVPAQVLWPMLQDIKGVAHCVPGANLTDIIGDNHYRGTIAIKLGPVSASFSGDVTVQIDEHNFTGVVTGQGNDGRTSSRANARMRYRLEPLGESRSALHVETSVQLSGLLAQFGKSAIIGEVSRRLGEQFAANLERTLSNEGRSTAAPGDRHASTIRMHKLLFEIVWRRIVAFWKWFDSYGGPIR